MICLLKKKYIYTKGAWKNYFEAFKQTPISLNYISISNDSGSKRIQKKMHHMQWSRCLTRRSPRTFSFCSYSSSNFTQNPKFTKRYCLHTDDFINLWYLDDGNLVVPIHLVPKVLKILNSPEASSAVLYLNLAKSTVFSSNWDNVLKSSNVTTFF